MAGEVDSGAPGALGCAVEALAERVGAGSIGRLWLFPPSPRGRRERGLVAASSVAPGEAGRRRLYTVSYEAELTGRGVEIDLRLEEHGEAGPEHLSRVMEGVVRRGGGRGDPREIHVDGSEERVRALAQELKEAADSQRSTPGSPNPTWSNGLSVRSANG